MDVESWLVEKTVDVTEETVRRRVVQKFSVLRVRVLRDCLALFLKGVIEVE